MIKWRRLNMKNWNSEIQIKIGINEEVVGDEAGVTVVGVVCERG